MTKDKSKSKKSGKKNMVDFSKIKDALHRLYTMNEYAEKYEMYRDMEERYNEISEDLYDLMGDQLLIEKEFIHVWGIADGYERYFNPKSHDMSLMPTANGLRMKINGYIERNGINPWSVPDIPLTEYILVPTGNIQAYHAHNTPEERKREIGTIRWREWNWKNKIFDKQDEKYKQRKEAYYEGQRSKEDWGTSEGDDGARSEDERG